MTPGASRSDDTILVAGASGAVGREVMRRAVADGWRVLASGRRGAPNDLPTGAIWIDSGQGLGSALQSALCPNTRLKAVLFCIGSSSSKQAIAATPLEEWTRLYQDNVVTLAELWRAVAPWARSAKAGVVALSSDATSSRRPGNGAYTAAKAALEALVLTLAKEELAHGIRANILAPSLIRSPMGEEVLRRKGEMDAETYYLTLPWGRPLSTEEVAQVALDIATAPQWRYASGQVFKLAVQENA